MTPAVVEVIAGTAPALAGSGLVVRVAPYQAPAIPTEVSLGVAIADPELAARLTCAVTAAITTAIDALFATAPEPPRVVELRARAAATRRAAELPGAIVLVPVTERNARHLVELVGQLRDAGAAAVQLIWDGASPPRARVERHVFAVLEHARATPAGPPVVLAATREPAAALQLLLAHRKGNPR